VHQPSNVDTICTDPFLAKWFVTLGGRLGTVGPIESIVVSSPAPSANPGFRLLWIGTGLSALGDFVGMLALSFVAVRRLHASSRDLAALALFEIVAGLIAAPIAGVVIDRCRRRPLLIAADFARAGALAIVPVAAHIGHLSFAVLWVVGAITAASTVLFNGAYSAYSVRLVGREHIVRANAILAVTVAGTEIAGFAASGWIVAWVGEVNAQWIDAGSFVASALCVLAIVRRDIDVAPKRGRKLVRAWPSLVGPRFVWASPVLRSIVATDALFTMAVTMVSISYLLYLAGDLGYRSGTLGTIFAVGGVMSLVGAKWVDRSERRGGLGRALAISGFVRTVGMAFMPAAFNVSATSTALLIGNQVVTDPAWMLHEIAVASIRQAHTPDEIAGRVASTRQFLGSLGRLAGAGATALIGGYFGPRAVLWSAVGVAFVASLGLALSAAARVSGAGRVPATVPVG
jgi:MFS family permease